MTSSEYAIGRLLYELFIFGGMVGIITVTIAVCAIFQALSKGDPHEDHPVREWPL